MGPPKQKKNCKFIPKTQMTLEATDNIFISVNNYPIESLPEPEIKHCQWFTGHVINSNRFSRPWVLIRFNWQYSQSRVQTEEDAIRSGMWRISLKLPSFMHYVTSFQSLRIITRISNWCIVMMMIIRWISIQFLVKTSDAARILL